MIGRDPVINLARAITATIREYRATHPDDGLTDAECGEALDLARDDATGALDA